MYTSSKPREPDDVNLGKGQIGVSTNGVTANCYVV